jgi:hypothetical protein
MSSRLLPVLSILALLLTGCARDKVQTKTVKEKPEEEKSRLDAAAKCKEALHKAADCNSTGDKGPECRAVQAMAPYCQAVLAMGAQGVDSQTKALEAAVALQNTLTGWAFLIIGGSLLLILGTSYYRPLSRGMRLTYLFFVPGWGLLAASIYKGTQVQGVYLASLFSDQKLGSVLSDDLSNQIVYLQAGLSFFGCWLIIYLFWWIFSGRTSEKEKV